MVRAMIAYMLGPSGMAVLRAYEAHSLLVNGAIVLYGALLTAAHVNMRRLKTAAARQLNARIEASGVSKSKAVQAWSRSDWERLLVEQNRFPFIAEGLALIPRRSTAQSLMRALPASELSASLDDLNEEAGRPAPDS